MTRILAASALAVLVPLSASATGTDSPVVVTRDSLALNCSPREAAEVVLRFERALEAGDRKALDAVFVRTGFKWYSRDRAAIRDRKRLIPFLLADRARGVRIRLLAVDVANSNRPHAVALGLTLEDAHGKAEIDCRSRRIYVWSIGSGAAGSPCPQPPQANALRTVVACSRSGTRAAAQEVSRDFVLDPTPLRLPVRCRPPAVKARLVAAMRAFDLGGAAAFARHFAPRALVQPYTASQPPLNLVGRAQVAAFASARAARGDGWTAARILPPTGTAGLPAEAVYGLALRITPWHPTDAGVKLVIDCRSGLVRKWVGPGVAPPG